MYHILILLILTYTHPNFYLVKTEMRNESFGAIGHEHTAGGENYTTIIATLCTGILRWMHYVTHQIYTHATLCTGILRWMHFQAVGPTRSDFFNNMRKGI